MFADQVGEADIVIDHDDVGIAEEHIIILGEMFLDQFDFGPGRRTGGVEHFFSAKNEIHAVCRAVFFLAAESGLHGFGVALARAEGEQGDALGAWLHESA